MLLGIAGGVGYTLVQTPQYQSTTTLAVPVSPADRIEGATLWNEAVESYAQVATAPVVLAPVIQRLGLRLTVSQLATKVTAEAVQSPPIIKVISAQVASNVRSEAV